MSDIDEKKTDATVNKAYDVLLKFLETANDEELSKRQVLKVAVAQTVIKTDSTQRLAKAKVAATHVSIAQTVLDNPEERKKYLAFTLPGITKALPEGQRPEELKQIESLKNERDSLKGINDKLLTKISQMQESIDELKFQLLQEQEKHS